VPNYTVAIAASVAIVGADLFEGQVWARAPQNRVVDGAALRGSAAAGDSEVELHIDEVRISSLFNNNTGFPNNDDLLPLESLLIPAGAQLRAIVVDAAASNPLNAMVALRDV